MVTKFFLVKVIPLFFILLLFCGIARNVYAGNGTISVQPSSGEFTNGDKFNAQIKIDGGGSTFNASKARVAVSSNLIVEGLTLGDCDFAFVETPSTNSLSFAGVILGGFTKSCTVYTLNLRVNGNNNGFIFITDAAIKAYEGAIELFSKANNSSYTFTGGSSSILQISPTQAPLSLNNGVKYYTLVYSIPPVDPRMTVVIDQDLPTEMIKTPAPHPNNPTVLAATFDNVVEGVHTIDVLRQDEKLTSEIVNIQGDNREINLGVEPEEPKTNYLLYGLIAVIVILLLSGAVLGYLIYWRKSHMAT